MEHERLGPFPGLGHEELEEMMGRGSTVMVPLHVLRPADSPRLDGLDESHVRVLARMAAIPPPILVHRPTMRVIDGMHRLRAAVLRKREQIEVRFVDGTPESAFVLAVEMNIARGLSLSLADREAAAARIIASYPQWSDRAIAAKAGLSPRTVGVIRRCSTAQNEHLKRVGRDGRVRPLSSAAGRLRASALISANPDVSLRAVAEQAGISIGTAHDVRERVRRGESPVPDGRRRADAAGSGNDLSKTPAVGGADEAEDLSELWEKVANDPSLRLTESGRTLLRSLSCHTITPSQLNRLVEAVPVHTAAVVKCFALRCAEAWRQLAEELEKRAQISA